MATTRKKVTKKKTITRRATKRIWEVARELDIPPAEVIAAARRLGLRDVTRAASAITNDDAVALRNALLGREKPLPPSQSEASAEPSKRRKGKKNNARKKKRSTRAEETLLVVRKTPKRAGNAAHTEVCMRFIKGL